MWIVDDEGDMFNTDHFNRIGFDDNEMSIFLVMGDDETGSHYTYFLAIHLTDEERLTRYYDLVEKLTGDRIDA